MATSQKRDVYLEELAKRLRGTGFSVRAGHTPGLLGDNDADLTIAPVDRMIRQSGTRFTNVVSSAEIEPPDND